jgi:hypothetical protein
MIPAAGRADDGDGRHDFDFLIGGWRVRNRKLSDVIGSARREWVEFDTEALTMPILDGLSHVGRIWCDEDQIGGPWEVFALRQFDPAERIWRIWSASTRSPGRLGAPLAGRFTDRMGMFTGDGTIAGHSAKIRFEWASLAPGRARWSRAFSFDAGLCWQVNWIMELARISRRKPVG